MGTGVYPLQQNTTVDVAATPSEVVVDDSKNQIVESTTQQQEVTVNVIDATIYSAGVQGPQGPAGASGSWEDAVPYNEEIDFEGDYIYKGEADPGTATDAPLWRVKRIAKVVGGDGVADYRTQWADGDANFDNIWDNRLGLTYS